ncbi:hypothetical protein MNB_SV-14-394 [hydrothermal vent metagenome]|uniref:Uncharacterized protein n=1 Tax=hydrothermal vent metagenome TaxID=652676 RepID=A0A1W1CDZ9_9ZZZZ
MSYKNDLKHKIASVLHYKNDYSPHPITQILNTIYKEALEESKQTGQSVSSITYEILEGLEESHQEHIEHIESQLTNASSVIAMIIYKSAQKNIKEKEKKLEQVKAELIDTIEAEILHLLESLDTFNAYANDKSYTVFKQSLSKRKIDILKKIDALKTLLP